MFGFAWLAIRQAREALKQGRLEEAHRLLTQPAIRDQRAIGELLAQLVRGYVERGERHLKLDDAQSAWRDLLQAEQLQTAEKSVARSPPGSDSPGACRGASDPGDGRDQASR